VLWKQMDSLIDELGLERAPLPSAEELRVQAADVPRGTSLCALSMQPLPEPGAPEPPIFFCGRAYYASCVNFWVNLVSSSPPAEDSPLQF
jgi:hypothetical protein